MKIAVIGSGPTGLSAAYELSKHGIHTHIYEKDKIVGGLAKSVDLWEEKVELGPHFLKEDLESSVQELLFDILKAEDILHYDRLTRIYINETLFDYPPSAKNFMFKLGIGKTAIAGISFIKAKLTSASNDHSVESFIKQALGNYLYANFFKEYTEKLWGIDCKMIDENYAKAMIGFGSLNIGALLKKYFIRSNTHLYKKCLYPAGGMSTLWNNLKSKIEDHGGSFFFSADIKEIEFNNELNEIQLGDGNSNKYDFIISTVSEMILLRMIKDADNKIINDLSNMRFRSVIAVFVKVDHCNFLEDNCIYLYSKKTRATRITNYNRFRNQPGNDILMIEYWVDADNDLWNCTEVEMLTVIKEDFSELSKGKQINILETKTIKLRNAYPVPLKNLKEIKQNTSAYLNSFKGLITAGRSNQNNFNYGMEEALAEGIYKAREILHHHSRGNI